MLRKNVTHTHFPIYIHIHFICKFVSKRENGRKINGL